MLPFFFGSNQRRLFGVYETATHYPATGAALLCSSWGREYSNAHRSIRALSKRLCAIGLDTLRFDYYGAGDSGGETVDAQLDGWRADISTALSELKDMSGRPRIAVVGMRLGATLVAQSAQQLSIKADNIILWDPILCGSDYVDSLLDRQNRHDEKSSDPAVSGSSAVAADSELGGLLVSSSFVDGLSSIDLCSRRVMLPSRVLTIFTDGPHRDCEIGSLSKDSSEVATLKAPSPWKDSAEQEEGLPVEVIDRILKWLK
ncbi:hypothetical protein FXB40_26570 [Bradyrhizobium rifense]|uniref:Uncharacterized protein n=1 Tax=Bradyrhizobium rifense TaxID=515499 RepID=A0A5D3K923_9BRAD|nr:alpha/beta hydrolase [Bradyrhizobium rifense]TYL92013.1 hypothetical protein FXB40_26570 [Bradyrhizobium rifense]